MDLSDEEDDVWTDFDCAVEIGRQLRKDGEVADAALELWDEEHDVVQIWIRKTLDGWQRDKRTQDLTDVGRNERKALNFESRTTIGGAVVESSDEGKMIDEESETETLGTPDAHITLDGLVSDTVNCHTDASVFREVTPSERRAVDTQEELYTALDWELDNREDELFNDVADLQEKNDWQASASGSKETITEGDPIRDQDKMIDAELDEFWNGQLDLVEETLSTAEEGHHVYADEYEKGVEEYPGDTDVEKIVATLAEKLDGERNDLMKCSISDSLLSLNQEPGTSRNEMKDAILKEADTSHKEGRMDPLNCAAGSVYNSKHKIPPEELDFEKEIFYTQLTNEESFFLDPEFRDLKDSGVCLTKSTSHQRLIYEVSSPPCTELKEQKVEFEQLFTKRTTTPKFSTPTGVNGSIAKCETQDSFYDELAAKLLEEIDSLNAESSGQDILNLESGDEDEYGKTKYPVRTHNLNGRESHIPVNKAQSRTVTRHSDVNCISSVNVHGKPNGPLNTDQMHVLNEKRQINLRQSCSGKVKAKVVTVLPVNDSEIENREHLEDMKGEGLATARNDTFLTRVSQAFQRVRGGLEPLANTLTRRRQN